MSTFCSKWVSLLNISYQTNALGTFNLFEQTSLKLKSRNVLRDRQQNYNVLQMCWCYFFQFILIHAYLFWYLNIPRSCLGWSWYFASDLHLQFHNPSTAEHVRHLLVLSKTWALLRPDLEPVWTLLAATLRLYSGLQGVKAKSKAAAREGAVASLFSALTVCSPDPTSEVFAEIIVGFGTGMFCY